MMKLLPFAVALALAGCAMVGPDYQRPETGLPPNFANQEAKATELVSAEWWRLYQDPVLDELVRAGYERSTDLAFAAAQVEEAEAVLREAHAVLVVPTTNLNVGATRGRVIGNTPPVGNSFSFGASTAFEVDVWGRLRRGERAARAFLLATRYGQETVRITMAATVARSYFTIRALDAQRRASEEIVVAATESLELATKRADAGLVPALDIYQAGSLRATASAQLKEVARLRELLEHQLAVITGRPTLTVAPGTLTALPIPPHPPAGLPSQLLERRPDVREAEAQLMSATELVGVARGSEFPALSLTAALGVANPEISSLFTTGSKFWSVGAGLTGPLLDGGASKARTAQAAARAKQAEAAYQGAVRSAFRDVADALTNVQRAGETETELKNLVDQARETLRLSKLRYERGYSPYLEVLDAQRTLNNAQIELIRNRQAYLGYTVDLMVALGGGWVPPPSAQG